MTWDEFETEKKLYVQGWKKMKETADGEMRKFLAKSWLVVCCKEQFDIDADFLMVLHECPTFFKNVPKKEIQKEMVGVSPGELLIDDSWTIEVRFPTVDMDLIQQIKNSPCCDQERTMMSRASINVVLKRF